MTSIYYKPTDKGTHTRKRMTVKASKERMVPRDKSVKINKNSHRHTFMVKMEPWFVEIRGFEEVQIIRSTDDVSKYGNNLAKCADLFIKGGCFPKTRPCPNKGCKGKLKIHFKECKDYMRDRHGGYHYKCCGKQSKCKSYPSSQRKGEFALTHNSIFDKSLLLIKHLKLIYAYSVVSHQVMYSISPFIHKHPVYSNIYSTQNKHN